MAVHDVEVLTAIEEHPGVTVRGLGVLCDLSSTQSVWSILERLHEEGLWVWEQHCDFCGPRSRTRRLTLAGREMLHGASAVAPV